MKHLLFFLLAFPFLASAQILEKQFVATVQYNGFTQINDSLYRGDLIEFRDVLIEGYQPSGVDSGFICLDGTGRAYRVEVVNSFDYSSLNVDLIELDDYDEIPIGVGIVAERYGSTYQIPNGLVNSIGISSVLQAKILNHNTKIAATTVQPPDTLYLQELSGTTAISNGDTIPLIDYVKVVDTPAMLLNYPSTAGYGIIDGGKTWRADTTSPNGLATRLFAKTLPSIITSGQVAYSNGSNLVGSANYFWDNTNVRLGIGTNAPTRELDITRATNATAGIVITNTGGGSGVESVVNTNNGVSALVHGKRGTGYGSYKIMLANDGYLYNALGGDISILNDVGAGKIKFSAGASSTAQMTLAATGNLLLGTTTDVPTSILTARSTTKSSSPFPLHTLAESDAITGVQGNFDYETTQNGLRWYNGTRKAYALESTFARGTATRVPYFDGNGQVTDGSGLTYTSSRTLMVGTTSAVSTATPARLSTGGTFSSTANANLKILVYDDGSNFWGWGVSSGLTYFNAPNYRFNSQTGGTILGQLDGTGFGIGKAPAAALDITNTNGGTAGGIMIKNTNTGLLGYASVYLESANGENSQFFSTNSTYTGYRTISASSFGHYSSAANGMAIQLDGASAVLKVGIGTNEITRTTPAGFSIFNTSPQRALHVTGEARITDLTTDTPSRILGADADGDLADITWLVPLSTSSLGIGVTPTENLDINGDLRVRDSTRITTTPAHSAITGLLTRDASGWVGLASLAGGLSYSGGVLTGQNLSNTDMTLTGNRQIIGANYGLELTNVSNFEGFDADGSGNFYAFGFSPGDFYLDVYKNTAAFSEYQMFILSDTTFNYQNNGGGRVSTLKHIPSGFLYSPVSGSEYRLLPNGSVPAVASGAKNIIQWTGDGSNANPAFVEIKRDTTIYVDDADYDWSAAITTAQIASRFNRVIFWMTTTGAAGSDSEITLHTPDVNLMQVEYVIHSVDEAGGFSNKIVFGTNNAVDSTNGLVTNYYPAAGDGVHIRAGLRSAAYKYRYSN